MSLEQQGMGGLDSTRENEQDPVEAQRRAEREIKMAGVSESNVITPLENTTVTPEEAIVWFKSESAEEMADMLLKSIEKLKQTRPNEVVDKIALDREFIRDFIENAKALERTKTGQLPDGAATMNRIRELSKKLKPLIQ